MDIEVMITLNMASRISSVVVGNLFSLKLSAALLSRLLCNCTAPIVRNMRSNAGAVVLEMARLYSRMLWKLSCTMSVKMDVYKSNN